MIIVRHSWNIRNTLCIISIGVLSFLIYIGSLGNGFVYDDHFLIENNPWIKDVTHIIDAFTSDSWSFNKDLIHGSQTSSHYAPLRIIFNTVQHYIFGNSALMYHLTNVLLHSLNSIMVFLLTSFIFRRFFNDSRTVYPLMASFLFAIHPVHAEAVLWISAVGELCMTFLVLLSFYLYIKTESGGFIKSILSALCFLAALLFKLTALTLLPLLMIYDILLRYASLKSWLKHLRQLSTSYLLFMVVLISFVVLRYYAIGGFVPVLTKSSYDIFSVLLNAAVLLSQYFLMLVYPHSLNIIHVFHPVRGLLDFNAVFGLAAIFLFGILLFFSRKNRPLFFFLLWIFFPLLPVLYYPAFVNDYVFAERYLYLPSVGFFVVVAIVFNVFSHRLHRLYAFAGYGILLVFSIYSLYTTITRVPVWRNDFTLWTDTLKKSPDSFTAHNNIGIIYLERGEFIEAEKHFKEAIALFPNFAEAYVNLGNVFYKQGMFDRAQNAYETALLIVPGYKDAIYNLSLVRMLYEKQQSN